MVLILKEHELMNYLIVLLIVLFTGCSVREYQLFNNENPSYISRAEDINISYDSKIVADDILSIDVYNMNQKSNILKNNLKILDDNTKSNEYLVSVDGTIYLPLLQEVEVIGFTAKELSKKFTQEYKRYLKQPYVKVAIKNHKIFVLGEVKKQGVIPINGNSISIIEAISSSGGLTNYAARNKIRIISKMNKKYTIRTLNMSKLSTLNIDNLMLKHNSIVYVEPRDAKALTVGVQDYLPIIQAISGIAATILTIDYIQGGK
jgi:polysaccharide export outer membrane protein